MTILMMRYVFSFIRKNKYKKETIDLYNFQRKRKFLILRIRKNIKNIYIYNFENFEKVLE